jgi:hypothetical protein
MTPKAHVFLSDTKLMLIVPQDEMRYYNYYMKLFSEETCLAACKRNNTSYLKDDDV